MVGLSPKTLERARCSGTGPAFVKLGRKVDLRRRQAIRSYRAALRLGPAFGRSLTSMISRNAASQTMSAARISLTGE